MIIKSLGDNKVQKNVRIPIRTHTPKIRKNHTTTHPNSLTTIFPLKNTQPEVPDGGEKEEKGMVGD